MAGETPKTTLRQVAHRTGWEVQVTPEAECVVQTPVASHSVFLVPVGQSVTLTNVDPALAVAVTDQLALSCACDDVLATLRLRRFPGAPLDPPQRPPSSAGSEVSVDQPDEVIEVVWELTISDPFVAHVIDYGATALPGLGVTPGRWKVRVAVWGRAEAEALEEEMIEQDLTEYIAWEADRIAREGDSALGTADGADMPQGPEAWALDFWPA